MKIEILSPFEGQPDETKSDLVSFLTGAVVDVPDAWGAMAVAKGLAREVKSDTPAKKAAPNEAK